MKSLIVIVLALLLSGCATADKYTAVTEADYSNVKTGTTAHYRSGKDQTGFQLRYEFNPDGTPKSAEVSVDKSVTPIEAMAAALKENTEAWKMVRELMSQMMKGAGKMP